MRGELGKGTEPGRQIRGSSLRFLPPLTPPGFSKPKPAAYLKKKKKALKESYRRQKKTPTNTHTHEIQTVLPSPRPPPPNTRVSCFISFKFCLSPLCLGSQGRLRVGGGRHAAGRAHLWPEGGGSGRPHDPLDPDTRQPASWAPARKRGARAGGPHSGALSTSGLSTCRPLYLLQLKSTVSSWARNRCHVRDGHCPSRTQKPGLGRGDSSSLPPLPTPQNSLCWHSARRRLSLKLGPALCTHRFRAPFSGKPCCGLAADSAGSQPPLLRGRRNGPRLAGPR